MKWYAERKNIFGQYAATASVDYPPDRTSDGMLLHYRVRVAIAPEHQSLNLAELSELYGTK